MAYSDHVGPGHTWHKTHLGRGVCQCGMKLPANLILTRSLPKSQLGQHVTAHALDLLAEHGLVDECVSPVTLRWNYETGSYS